VGAIARLPTIDAGEEKKLLGSGKPVLNGDHISIF